MTSKAPVLALTQGDPAGIGPEVLLKMLAQPPRPRAWRPLLLAERAAFKAVPDAIRIPVETRLVELHRDWNRESIEALPAESIAFLDPVDQPRPVIPGTSTAADAAGALAALDLAIEAVQSDRADAVVTLPVSKESIARHCLPGFLGHTEYLAAAAGLDDYGRDYLMTFLSPDLRVALLSTHVPLARAIEDLSTSRIVEALELLHRETHARIAVAGLNPHAGEGGLIGLEDDEIIVPAVAAARRSGIDAHGPESADSLFARARKGEFEWVLALYHDQGLIAVKTAAFGTATNWTLGLPFLRTSVDHGTAFALAGRGIADEAPLRAVVETTLDLTSGSISRRFARGPG